MGYTRVTVSVPASSANLGPGFDSFGLALGLRNRFTAAFASDWRVDVAGEGIGVLATGSDNKVAQAMARGFAEAGSRDRAAHVMCENVIPPGSGLGSSAAAVVGGLMLANALCGDELSIDRIFALAAELEGHPDNAAPALFGGFNICWADETGVPHRAHVPLGAGLAAVVVTREAGLSTREARVMLPASVPHADASFNAARAGLLATGLAEGRDDLIAAGLGDRLHEPYRAAAIPDFGVVREALLDAGAIGAVLSGAGPTVLGLVTAVDGASADARAHDVAQAASETLAGLDGRAVRALAVDREGAFLG